MQLGDTITHINEQKLSGLEVLVIERFMTKERPLHIQFERDLTHSQPAQENGRDGV